MNNKELYIDLMNHTTEAMRLASIAREMKVDILVQQVFDDMVTDSLTLEHFIGIRAMREIEK